MSTYCPDSEIQAKLPPNSVGTGSDQITTAQLTECTAYGSNRVNSKLGHLYWPFTDYAASPAASPPWIIREAATRYGVSRAYLLLRAVNDNVGDSLAIQWEDSADKLLAEYADGTRQIEPQTATQLLHSASWGDGDPLSTNQAYLTLTEVQIIIDSATIPNYIYGDDFVVYYLTNHRRWVVERYDSAIGSATTPSGDTITFEYSFLKKREMITAGIRQIDVIRG